MENKTSLLSQKSFVVIFAYAPAGLGHLRVTDALYHGLPAGVTPILLGSQDQAIRNLHRLISTHPFALSLMQWAQQGAPEHLFTILYRSLLRKRSHLLYQQLKTIFDQRIEIPKTMLVVATHFGLAHQLAAVKQKFEKEKGIRIILVVQVTDDSPQYIWYVKEADLIFVPSHKTKQELLDYGKTRGDPKPAFEVIPYPVSPILAQHTHDFNKRAEQVNANHPSTIHVAIPVSGAAAGMNYTIELMSELHKISERFVFHVIAKKTSYTQSFVTQMLTKNYIQLQLFSHDREVVDAYEKLYQQHTISLEITKPSEQAFKAILSPKQIGGSILLFAKPVGQQEYDNLDFLKRHHLLPTSSEQTSLWEHAEKNSSSKQVQSLVEQSTNWRGIMLPQDPNSAASFVFWCLKNKVFERMLHCSVTPCLHDNHEDELLTNGVLQFWEKVSEYVHKLS